MRIKSVLISLVFVSTLSAMEDTLEIKEFRRMVQELPLELRQNIQEDVFDDLALKRPQDFNRLIHDVSEITGEQAEVALKKFEMTLHEEYLMDLFARVRSDKVKKSLTQEFFKKNCKFFRPDRTKMAAGWTNMAAGWPDELMMPQDVEYWHKTCAALAANPCPMIDLAFLVLVAYSNRNYDMDPGIINKNIVRVRENFFDKTFLKLFFKVYPPIFTYLNFLRPAIEPKCSII